MVGSGAGPTPPRRSRPRPAAARALVLGLLRRDPRERTSLDDAAAHPWTLDLGAGDGGGSDGGGAERDPAPRSALTPAPRGGGGVLGALAGLTLGRR